MTKHTFTATLVRYSGTGGWTFAQVPEKYAPPYTLGWGRTPVHATVDGKRWKTSVWTDKKGIILLPVPKRIRGTKDHGERVLVTIEYIV